MDPWIHIHIIQALGKNASRRAAGKPGTGINDLQETFAPIFFWGGRLQIPTEKKIFCVQLLPSGTF